jgi:hypothetical protein
VKRYLLPGGQEILNVHDESDCEDQPACIIHRPTEHHMSDWPLHWRGDRGIFERICSHGVGHPDPDQFYYWEKRGLMPAEAVHGCDSCCAKPERKEFFI